MPPVPNRSIEAFLTGVRRVLNKHQLWNCAIWALAFGAGALAIAGLLYTLRGYEVPRGVIGLLGLVTLIGGGAFWAWRRLSVEGSARAADTLFGLRDSLLSYLHFSRSGKSGGMYDLQADQTQRRIEALDPQAIEYAPPRRGITLAACLLAIAVPLGMRGPSAVRLAEQQLADDTAAATVTINRQLDELVDELHRASEGDEKELLNANQLREWVDELKPTADHKEALRQYAKLERQLNSARLALQNQRDQRLLEQAARRLETTRETQGLAEQLHRKDYDQSAAELQKLAPTAKQQPLSKQRQELARLKAAAQHLAAAAKAAQSASSGAQSSANGSSKAGEAGESGKSAGSQGSGSGAGSSGGGDMAETMQALDQAVADLDDSLSEAERQESQRGDCDAKQQGECQACRECVNKQLSNLQKQLCKLGMCQRADKKLCKLCQACSQCQGNLCSMCNGANPGGKKAGTGSNTARREGRDELVDNGMTTQLKSQKGRGSSQTSVESAESGSGVSSRRAVAQQRTFQRQVESFVAREDIPEEVKAGVKQYFQVIHDLPPNLPTSEGAPDADDGN